MSAAIASASFFGFDMKGEGLILYLVGLGLITGGVATLLARSFNEALKEDEDTRDEPADALDGEENDESHLKEEENSTVLPTDSTATETYSPLSDGEQDAEESRRNNLAPGSAASIGNGETALDAMLLQRPSY